MLRTGDVSYLSLGFRLSLLFRYISQQLHTEMKTNICNSTCSGNAEVKCSIPKEIHLPPSLEDLTHFMAKNAGKLGSYPFCEVAPFEYTGSDYCIVLAACIPESVPLSIINWGPNPLGCQLAMNLFIFCKAALQLRDSGAPESSLHPELLRPIPSCLFDHLKVQHWLFILAQRSPPPADYNPTLLRQYYSNLQCGEPYLVEQRSGNRLKPSLQHGCSDMKDVPPVSSQKLAMWGPYYEALNSPELQPKEFLLCTPGSSPCEGKANTDEDMQGTACSSTGANRKNPGGSSTPSSSTPATGRSKPWQSYSKPWNLPSLAASEARKAKQEAAIKKRVEKARQAGVRAAVEDAFAKSSTCLGQQYAQSSQRRKTLYQSLVKIQARVLDDVFRGSAINYAEIISMLEEAKE